MAEFTVVWDGRRSGPGGALLFAPEVQARRVEPVYRVRGGNRERIIAALEMGPATSRQLSISLGMPVDVVHDALRPMRVEGRITVTRGAFRRHVYALVQS